MVDTSPRRHLCITSWYRKTEPPEDGTAQLLVIIDTPDGLQVCADVIYSEGQFLLSVDDDRAEYTVIMWAFGGALLMNADRLIQNDDRPAF